MHCLGASAVYLMSVLMTQHLLLGFEQVQGSTVASKRSFLERKGLTATEIDEAFRRVPDAPAPLPTTAGQFLPLAC